MKRWIKLYEEILNWEWSDDPSMMAIWSRLLVMANYKDMQYRNTTIKRGQILTSLRKLSAESGVSVRTLRTCLDRLVIAKQVTLETTHTNTLITICNYEKYQGVVSESDTESDTLPTHQRHTTDTPNKVERVEYNNIINNSVGVENARTHEEILEDFFRGKIYVEALCMQKHIDMETCYRLAKEVINDWSLTGVKHKTTQDAKEHLLNHLRRKIDYYIKHGQQSSTDNSKDIGDNPLSRAKVIRADIGDDKHGG